MLSRIGMEEAMRLLVTEKEFVWRNGEEARKASELHPPETCIFEEIEVVRNGAVLDTGTIRHLPEEGYDAFEGFEVLCGERKAFKVLKPSLFKPGDEVVINLLRANVPEQDYWEGLTSAASKP
jgi:hypothetical protein